VDISLKGLRVQMDCNGIVITTIIELHFLKFYYKNILQCDLVTKYNHCDFCCCMVDDKSFMTGEYIFKNQPIWRDVIYGRSLISMACHIKLSRVPFVRQCYCSLINCTIEKLSEVYEFLLLNYL